MPLDWYTTVTVLGSGSGSPAWIARVFVTVTDAPAAKLAGKSAVRLPSRVSLALTLSIVVSPGLLITNV